MLTNPYPPREPVEPITERLLPCPFCGAEAVLEPPAGRESGLWWAACTNCAAFMSGAGALHTIIRWNRRVASFPKIPPGIRSLLARCLSQIECEWGAPDAELRAVLGVPLDAPLGTKPPEEPSC